MKAAVLTEYKKIELKDVPFPPVKDSEVMVRVSSASICGTDQHIFSGAFHPRTHLPLIPGHEFVGTITEMGKEVTGFKEGDFVAVDPIIWCGKCPACEIGHYPACTSLKLLGIDMDGGFAEYVAADASKLYPIDPGISATDAALVEPYAIGFHASKRAGVQSGDKLAFYGSGKIGQSIMQAARTITDNTVFIVDVIQKRLDMAKSAYPDVIAINARDANPVEVIMEQTGGKGVDIAFEAAGDALILESRVHPVREAIHSIRGAGKVCVLSLGDDEVTLVMKELIWKEGLLITSRVSCGEYKDALEHLAKGLLRPKALISSIMPLSQAQEAFEMIERDPDNHLKVILTVS
ncbi:zinc-binding dehydrogenase [Candidatus Latescibacterota bacterium]